MKHSILKIEYYVFFIGLLMISLAGSSQDIKLSKEEKKAIKKDKDQFDYQVVDSMIQRRSFVLEADYLENKYGIRNPVSSLLNFIEVDSDNAVLQTGSNSWEGLNSVGGVTAEGNIQGLEVTKDIKHLNFFVRFTVMSQIGIYEVAMTINSDKTARAEISGFGRGKLTYSGHILNPWESRAYKGRNTI
jgi:hypothetical protein